MRVDDFWIESDSGPGPAGGLRLDLLERLRAGPIAEYTDLEAAIALARLLDEQFGRCGTDATNEIGNAESREALRTLQALTDRVGVPFDPPYRDLAGFRAYWGSHDRTEVGRHAARWCRSSSTRSMRSSCVARMMPFGAN